LEPGIWGLGPGNWGIEARPNLPENPLLPIYLEGQKLATAGKLQEATERWRDYVGRASAVDPCGAGRFPEFGCSQPINENF